MNAAEREHQRQQDALDLLSAQPPHTTCRHEFLRRVEGDRYRCCQCGKRDLLLTGQWRKG